MMKFLLLSLGFDISQYKVFAKKRSIFQPNQRHLRELCVKDLPDLLQEAQKPIFIDKISQSNIRYGTKITSMHYLNPRTKIKKQRQQKDINFDAQQLYCVLQRKIMDIQSSKDQVKANHNINHLNYHITVKIPQKPQKNHENSLQTSPQQSQVSILPLESARIVTVGAKKRRINSEVKYIHVSEQAFVSPPGKNRIGKIKNVVFRPKLQKFISQEKSRLAALEQTMMFQRQRRLNKQECIKKIQRLMSPNNIKQRNHKKFLRTQDKKHEDNKKFKRIKEKEQPSQEQKLLQAKLIKKLREELPDHGLSRIAQHIDENYTQTILQPSNPQCEIPQIFSQPIQQSIIEQSTSKI